MTNKAMPVTLKSPMTPSTKTTLLEHVECDNNMWRHLANDRYNSQQSDLLSYR